MGVSWPHVGGRAWTSRHSSAEPRVRLRSYPRCWCFLVLAGLSHHAKSCRFMRNHALSGRIMQFRVMVLLGFSHTQTLVEFPKKRKGKIFVCLCCPHSTDLSVADSMCHGGVSQTLSSATTGWPCDEAAGRSTLRPQCLRAQADIFMGLSAKLPCPGKTDAIVCGLIVVCLGFSFDGMHPKNFAKKMAAVCASWNTIASLTNDLPDPMGCPILPENAWRGLILPQIAWFCLNCLCLKLPDFAWNCLKGCLNSSKKQITMTWRPESDWFCLMCFLSVWNCLRMPERSGGVGPPFCPEPWALA